VFCGSCDKRVLEPRIRKLARVSRGVLMSGSSNRKGTISGLFEFECLIFGYIISPIPRPISHIPQPSTHPLDLQLLK
jgi:hypothetical protein